MSGLAALASSEDELSLAQYVLAASRVLVGIAARSLAQNEDITVPQFRVLVLLAQRGPQRAADIAAGLSTSPSQATRLCDRLVRKQLVSRESVPGDRRGVLVLLTDQGEKMISDVMAHRLTEIDRMISLIPSDRHEMLLEAFRSFTAAAGEEPGEERAWAL